MPASTGKRFRGTSAEPALPTSSIREAVISRVAHETPEIWRHAAASTGVSGTDPFLVHLGRSISDALTSVTSSAVSARVQLQETRLALHAAIDMRCDDLAASIDTAEAVKVAFLERELIGVDTALERWRSESGAILEAVSSMADANLYSHYESLSSRVDAMEAQLQRLPTAVLEPPRVGLLADAPALLSSIAGFGRVLAPMSIIAADLSLEGVPMNFRPGRKLRLRLSLGARHAAQTAEELEVSLGMLVKAMQVDVTLQGPEVEPQPLLASIAIDTSQQCVFVSLEVPTACALGARNVIASIAVAGQAVWAPPLCIPACRSIAAPLLLSVCSTDYYTTPCISPEGQIFVPGTGADVLVFDYDGASQPGIPVASLGLSECTHWSAYTNDTTPLLLLADRNAAKSCLVAIDLGTNALRWASTTGTSCGCQGIAALPSLGAVVVSDNTSLIVHRLSDGTRIGSLTVPGMMAFLAADPAAGLLYGASSAAFEAHAWSCVEDGPRVRITSNGPIAAAGTSRGSRPLAVMPPAPGKRVSHLVVGESFSPELLVLSLPSLALVHTHSLEGMCVLGLAADPWGGALVIRNYNSKSVHVLAWPLPGMPPLL